MKVLIMCDMEGVSGIVAWSQFNGGAPMYEEGRPPTVSCVTRSRQRNTVDLPIDQAADFRGRPGVEVIDSDTRAVSRADTWMQAWHQIWGC
jgi:hypothetical protein